MRSGQPRTRRRTRLEYDALINAGVFAPDERLELIEGTLVVRESQATPHATAIRLADSVLRAALPSGWMLQIQLPLALEEDS